MRYLNKIVFIHSAAIQYTEIIVGGNVHFTGTQGVGKSTLLRAILFFYNADTQKLGIKPGQQSFSEYYFPKQDSYIIYEIAKETGAYSILCYKHLGKICFRFFDSEYRKNLFINEQNKAYENWEQIKEQLSKYHIASSNKIDRYEDYRDILYGNNDGKKEYRKYALLESKQYQNIPRTIQNVLLNAELKAEFIKETIIKSLSDEDIEIDLRIYKRELENFEMHLADIKKWTEKDKNGEITVRKQAAQIAKLHTALQHLDREKNQLAMQLACAIHEIKIQKPQLEEQLEAEQKKKAVLLKKTAELDDIFQKKREKISGEIKVLKTDIEKAARKKEEYEKRNIGDILQYSLKKTALLSGQENLSNEKQILSAQFTELTQRFEALLKEIENRKQRFVNSKKEESNTIQANFLLFKDETNTVFTNLIRQIREDHRNRLESAKELVEEKRKHLAQLHNKKTEIRHKRYFDAEIERTKSEITGFKNAKIMSENQIAHFHNQVKTVQTQFEAEEKSTRESFERQYEKLSEQIQNLQAETDAIDFKITNNKDSLYGWLNENYPAWENTIGKVIKDDENVLFNSFLEPKLSETSLGFYGIELNLTEINKTVKTVADYQKDKENVAAKIDVLKTKITEQTADLEKESGKLKDKYNPRIKEFKKEINNHTYELEQNQSKQEHAKLALSDFQSKAETAKKNDMTAIENEIAAAAEAELQAKNTVIKIEQSIVKIEKDKEKEKDKKIAEEKLQSQELHSRIEEELQKSNNDFAQQQQKIQDDMHSELGSKGGDEQRLREIEAELIGIKNELQNIENNAEILSRYKYDKAELFDKLGEFKNQKEILEKNLTSESQKHDLQKEKLQKDAKDIEEILKDLDRKIGDFSADMQEYDSFKTTEIYLNIPPAFTEAKDENKIDKNCRKLIREIYQNVHSASEKQKALQEEIHQFTGNFSVDNIFKFKTNFITTEEYLQFADGLYEFIEENKFERFEKDVNEMYSYIIKNIGRQTGNLMSKSGEIQKTITKINNDFIEKNFVGAIKKIELRWVESSSKIVSYLTSIDKFNNENQFFGRDTLFTSHDNDQKNRQAIELLKALLKTITESKKDKITLSDSFELQFRIIENQNDTGWVEKLANVGSDGTDILVKAMINIMLLNVSKSESSRHFKDFKLHCMMDEIGKLHSTNVKGILKFANERNILLINGSPEENNALGYKHIYLLYKDDKSITKVKRLITNSNYQ